MSGGADPQFEADRHVARFLLARLAEIRARRESALFVAIEADDQDHAAIADNFAILREIAGKADAATRPDAIGSASDLLAFLGYHRRFSGKLASLARQGLIRLEDVGTTGKGPIRALFVLNDAAYGKNKRGTH